MEFAYKIYEIEVDEKRVEKHNMSLVRGWSHQSIIKYARMYWEDLPDAYDKEAKVIYEYLVKLPVIIGKEVSLKEIKKQIN